MVRKTLGVFALIVSSCVLFVILALQLDRQTSIEEKMVQAQAVYTKLLKYTGAPFYPNPTLLYANTDIINAWTDGKNVTITKGMLEFTKTTSEIAAILGHEIGHIMLGHVLVGGVLDQRLNEANSDKYGTYLMLRAGYDVCAGRAVWQRFVDTYGNGILTQDHPSEADRAESLKFPQCN